MKHPAEFRGEAINVGTGTPTSIKDIWETLASIANVKMAVKYAPMRSAEIKHSVSDCSKLEYLLGLKITNRLGENLTSLYLRCGEKT
jgi:nucleoside-diphosphate-sugar epimerase